MKRPVETDPVRLPPGCTLGSLRRGVGPRAHWIYAEVFAPDGRVLIAATVEYCVRRMVESVPQNEQGNT